MHTGALKFHDAWEVDARMDDPEYQSSPNLSRAPEADYFARGREILGPKAGGLLAKLLKAKAGNVALARSAIEMASTKHNPSEYIGRVLSPLVEPGSGMLGGGYA